MHKFKKYLFWTVCILTMPLYLIVCTIQALCQFVGESLHSYEAWTFNYKDTGLIYRGDGVWSSPHEYEDGYEAYQNRFKGEIK